MKLHKVDVYYAKFDCPRCGKAHVDMPPWDKRLHRRHLCSGCNHQWLPDGIPRLAYSFGVDGPGWKLLAKSKHRLEVLIGFALAPFAVMGVAMLIGAFVYTIHNGMFRTLEQLLDWVFK